MTGPTYLSTGQIAAQAGVTVQTVNNWMHRGSLSLAGRRVKLASLRVGGRWKTTEAWWGEFLAACQGPPLPESRKVLSARAAAECADLDQLLGITR